MDFTISAKAVQLYINEMGLRKGDHLTFFVRVGGIGSGGFSVGVRRGKPELDYISMIQKDIIFCFLEEESWYFDGMTVDYDEDMGQMIFLNPKIENITNPN
ncbi:uncharacterized protein YneR [Evansella vedderi]|uniref:Uncharacterized protein YneR n=1 Tax=Evansella vedderi TaxID=38282 RepID=A0ABT9ZWY8_9BACI|nr:hypothetical protein [Evansella vedderi]MDQ0255741.1 uncharacterized protein YneR [Evansella vedderi]